MYYARKTIGKMRAYQEYMPYKNEKDTPLYPFGFGLSYSQFRYNDLTCITPEIREGQDLVVDVEVENTSTVDGQEIVQCYISRKVSSTTRPERELKAFVKCSLAAHEKKTLRITVSADELKFYGQQGSFMYETGELGVYVGGDSLATSQVTVQLK